jgi:hypothetical protein
MKDTKYEGWVAVYRTGKEYEGDVVRDRLDDAGLSAVVMSKRDSAFNLNVGSLSDVFVMVPPEHVDEARSMLAEDAIAEDELERMAMAASPDLDRPESDDAAREHTS